MTGALGRKKKAELECECCGCPDGCCPGINLEDITFLHVRCGPGELGCPDFPGIGEDPCLSGSSILTTCGVPPELTDELPGGTCNVFCNTDNNIAGSLGSYGFDLVISCTGDGSLHKAFIRYEGQAPPGLEADVWIETVGGFNCPDCSGENAGTEQIVELFIDVMVNCGVCNASDILYSEEGDLCVPDSLYSVRLYFEGSITCPEA
jgi:hypothetical protein